MKTTDQADADEFSRTLEAWCDEHRYVTLRGGMLGAFFVEVDTLEGSRRFLVEVSPGA